MFTVLIAEKQYIEAILQENKLFFEPLLENKELALCCWNPAGQSLRDSVPGLTDAVGRRREWRAVIVRNGTVQSAQNRNPFDIVEHGALDALAAPNPQPGENESLEGWEAKWKTYCDALTAEKQSVYQSALEHPLTRLATWLCFRPEEYVYRNAKEKQDADDWAMEMLGRDDQKPSTKLEWMERDQYRRELRLKEDLRRSFVGEEHLNIAYPAEVYCISPRAAQSNYFDPDAYWTIHKDSEYSTFADRNMYFDRMRFLVFDILSPTHRNFRTDYIRFLASVLIFASNPVPASAMQARRLYRLETETDEAPLCTMVTSYDKKLEATYDVIENEMEEIRSEIPGELTDKAAEELFCKPQDVSVLLDESCEPKEMLAETDYGLSFDCPEDEEQKWSREYQTSEKALTVMTKQRLRAVRKSVSRMNLTCEVNDVNISRLTPLQIEDIRDYTDTAENDMVASIPPDLTDATVYRQQMEQESGRVQKAIARRMKKKTVAALGAICLAAFLLCCLPFLLANGGTTEGTTKAIVLCVSLCGALALTMVVTLFYLRSTVTNAVKAYNKTAKEIIEDVRTSMERFSEYLSACCNVRRGHAVQNYARLNLDEYTKSLRIRKRHQEDIRKRRAQLAEDYGDYFGDSSCCDETMCRPYEYDFDRKTEYTYPAPYLADDRQQIEFISNGNFVTVPSSFIKRILVRMEGIYEE